MVLKITSHRGHHECEVAPEIGEAIFDKMTGRSEAPLSEAIKTKIPDTFAELERLWSKGKMGYTAISSDADDEMISLKNFAPEAKTVVFIAPITGG